MLRAPADLHVYSVPVLPRAGGDPGLQVRDADRHVEPGLHPGRAAHGVPAVPGGGRGRPARVHHRDLRHAAAETTRRVEAGAQLHQLQGIPEVLHGHHEQRWDCHAAGREVPPGEVPRSPREQGPRHGAQRLRRPTVPGLHEALPRMGPRRPDDAGTGTAPRLAAPTPPETTARTGERNDEKQTVIRDEKRRCRQELWKRWKRKVATIGRYARGDKHQTKTAPDRIYHVVDPLTSRDPPLCSKPKRTHTCTHVHSHGGPNYLPSQTRR